MIERSKRCEVKTYTGTSLLSSPSNWSRHCQPMAAVSVPLILAALAAAAPTREALVREANRLGQRPPPLNVAKADRDRSWRVPAALTGAAHGDRC